MDYSMLIGIENKHFETPKQMIFSVDTIRS